MAQRVIKKDDFDTLQQAGEIINQARAEAQHVMEQARNAYEQARKEGYQAGLEQGRMESAELLFSTVSSSIDYIDHLEKALVDVTLEAMDRLIGDQSDRQLLAQAVKNGLTHLRHQQKVVVRATPDVINYLEDHIGLTDAGGSTLVFLVDERLAADECVLESEYAMVTINARQQLENLKELIREKFASAEQTDVNT